MKHLPFMRIKRIAQSDTVSGNSKTPKERGQHDRKFFKNADWKIALLYSFLLVLIFAFPVMVPADMVSIGFVVLQYAIFALGINIIVGWTGLLDLGTAGFVAVGAYSSAILLTRFGCPPIVVLPLSAIIGFLMGIILGIPLIRQRFDYFAVLTLGLAELVSLTIRNWTPVTGGSFGYSGIPATRLPFMSEALRAVPPVGFYYLIAVVVVMLFIFIVWLRSTVLGRHFHIIKHDENVGQVCGINIVGTRLIAFGLSSAILSIGGFFWVSYQRSIIWTEFNVMLSCLLLSLIVLGGIGNPKGIFAGAVIIGSSLELIRRFLTWAGLPQDIRFLIFATALVVMIHIRSEGLIPDRPRWYSRMRGFGRDSAVKISEMSASITEYILEVKDLRKHFGGVVALDGFSLNIKPGECVALMGHNGSGKTTLLNSISGLIRPDTGSVTVNGKRVDRMAPFRIARNGVGRSFQDPRVCDELIVGDNVYIAAGDISRKEIDEVLGDFSLENGLTPCSSLSYGSRKNLDLARTFALSRRLKLVLLDEPTAGLTEKEALSVARSLTEFRERRRIAMLVISHDEVFLKALQGDRAVVIDRGKVSKEGDYNTIVNLFFGDTLEV